MESMGQYMEVSLMRWERYKAGGRESRHINSVMSDKCDVSKGECACETGADQPDQT